MVYRNYYARRFGTQGWRRPGVGWGARRGVYAGRPGFRWQGLRGFGYRPGYRAGLFGGRSWPRYGSAFSRFRQAWPGRYGKGYGYGQPGYGAVASPAYGGAEPQSGGAPQGALPPSWVAWAQSCLAQAVGPWVPQNGVMGKATRHAIRKFQKQQHLPPTGMLDGATISALQAACGGQGGQASAPAPAQGPPVPTAPAGDDVAAATAAAAGGAPPDAGAAPDAGGGAAPPPDGAPDGGAPPDASGGAQPDGPSGELYMRRFGRRRRRFRRRWGSGFNFQPQQPQQPDSDDSGDDGEIFFGGGRRGRWGGLQSQGDDGGDDGGNRWSRRRW
jgi:peptidoglycan hydrolase-like protein with peptidoglycan-binding domain